MPNYIRAKFEGGYYFFTVVTYRRRKLFGSASARLYLRQAIQQTRTRRPFQTIALCLLPDHLHSLWKLPVGDADFSTRWSSIKGLFSQQYLRDHSNIIATTTSRRRKGEVCIWQRRFWEHQIRDENDLNKHVDYIHYNAVKHGLVERVEDWPWSTYHRYVKEGFYKGDEEFADMTHGITTDFGE
jgi:putative transposase